MKRLIVLTTSPMGNQWRLHRFQQDYAMMQEFGPCVTLIFDLSHMAQFEFPTPQNYNNYPSRGALYNRTISEWIVRNGYTHDRALHEKPTRLLFELSIEGDIHRYRFIGKVTDYRGLK